MRKIKSKNTKPEIAFRSALHRRGFRYRIHVGDLPGKPDIVLPKYKAVIQIRGCFWHGLHVGQAIYPAQTGNIGFKSSDGINNGTRKMIAVWQALAGVFLPSRNVKYLRKTRWNVPLPISRTSFAIRYDTGESRACVYRDAIMYPGNFRVWRTCFPAIPSSPPA